MLLLYMLDMNERMDYLHRRGERGPLCIATVNRSPKEALRYVAPPDWLTVELKGPTGPQRLPLGERTVQSMGIWYTETPSENPSMQSIVMACCVSVRFRTSLVGCALFW